MLLNFREAAEKIGISKQALNAKIRDRAKKGKPFLFVTKDHKLRDRIDDESESWNEFVKNYKKGYGKKEIKQSVKKEKQDIVPEINNQQPSLSSNYSDLKKRATDAELEVVIYDAKIREEKSKQEELKTLEKMKSLAPIDLVRHFFSFAENMIQRIYRRPHEIEPQLAALFLAGESKKATQLQVRELESIIIDVQQELLKAIEEEGFKYKDEN